jgi:hypothetical protein
MTKTIRELAAALWLTLPFSLEQVDECLGVIPVPHTFCAREGFVLRKASAIH